MKKFFIIFLIYLLPLLILSELFGLFLPRDIPYGSVIITKLFLSIVGSIISITVLKNKYQLISFGNSFLSGFIVILIGLLVSAVLYFQLHEKAYHISTEEAFLTLSLFTLGQVFLLLTVLLIAGMWYTYQKAGQKGFAILIPIYNIIALLKIARKPTWWIVLLLIPLVNVVFIIMTLNGVAKNFGKDEGFTVGLVFLGAIFWSILGYGEAKYLGSNTVLSTQNTLLDDEL